MPSASASTTAVLYGTPELKGRLLLATGKLVSVPAEGCHASTEHHDDELGVTVPVLSSFVLP
jgi:hypothetical protein